MRNYIDIVSGKQVLNEQDETNSPQVRQIAASIPRDEAGFQGWWNRFLRGLTQRAPSDAEAREAVKAKIKQAGAKFVRAAALASPKVEQAAQQAVDQAVAAVDGNLSELMAFAVPIGLLLGVIGALALFIAHCQHLTSNSNAPDYNQYSPRNIDKN